MSRSAPKKHQPVYRQMETYIRGLIDQGVLGAGDQVPTEVELAHQFNVSRMTANKAITLLREQGILTRTAGLGTFVTPRQTEVPIMDIVDLHEEIKNNGGHYHAEIIHQEYRTIYGDAAWWLGIPAGHSVAYLEVLHFDNDVPTLLEQRYVKADYAKQFLRQDFTKKTATAYLLDHYPLSEIEQSIEAVNVDESIAQLLQINPSQACLRISRRTWSKDQLISHANLFAVGGRYKMHSRYLASAK
ncbi:GntR family transcriptional regulator [Advenella kashmirensis W13003]|uniref:GntR family transcriptional regulator n=2 Tax=Advenella kashmirensis TaxID=310575 RepID=V8QPS8_9BURK|nr:GntR family transcriptional regulator [Advenella kashmirensis W13003]